MKEVSLTKLDNVTKILLIILVVVICYFIIFSILGSFFVRQPTSMADMMNQMMGQGPNTNNLLSVIIALIIGVIISFYLFKNNEKDDFDNFNVIRKALSDDERKILDEIKKAGEITQDSLRFRLEWSKAKISTILTNLDKRGLIQRQRTGKTYKVSLEKHN